MMERRIEVKTYKVIKLCNEGEDPLCSGEMIPTGQRLLTHPAQYKHVCDKCGNVAAFRKRYPVIITEPVR